MLCITSVVLCVSQKDPGFDRGQFHKQVAVMRGQVSVFFFSRHILWYLNKAYVPPMLFRKLPLRYTFVSVLHSLRFIITNQMWLKIHIIS